MRSLAIDADPSRSALTNRFLPGTEPRATPTSTADPLSLHTVPVANGLEILPSGGSDARKLLVPKNLEAALSELRTSTWS